MDANQIIQLRQSKMSDSDIMDRILGQDQGFSDAVDRVKMANPNMSSLERAKLPTVMLNQYYSVPNKPIRIPQVVSGVQSASESAQEVRQKSESTWGKTMGMAAGNFLPSAGQFGKDVFMGIKNIFDVGDFTEDGFDFNLRENTIANVGKVGVGAAINLTEGLKSMANRAVFPVLNKIFGTNVQATPEMADISFLGEFGEESEEMASAIGGFYKDRYGSLEAARATFEQDPVGFAADAAMILTAASGVLRQTAKIPAALGKAGKANVLNKAATAMRNTASAIDPIENAARMFRKTASLNKAMFSKWTGLSLDDIDTFINKSDEVKAARKGNITRTGLAEEVGTVIDKMIDDLGETGKSYQGFRESGQIAQMPDDIFRAHLKANGYAFDDAGRVTSSFNNPVQLADNELAKLNKFLDDVDAQIYKRPSGAGQITSNEYMGLRSQISKASNFDGIKSSDLENIMKQLRKELNNKVRKQFNGLEDLDKVYEPQIKELKLLKKEWIDRSSGELKASAESKVMSINNKNRERLMKDLESRLPGITNRVDALRAIENVQLARGVKVGTYTSSIVTGGGLVTGNIPLIVAGIISQPDIIVPLLRGYGKVKGISAKTITAMTKRIKLGEKLTAKQAQIFANMLDEYEIMLREAVIVPERVTGEE